MSDGDHHHDDYRIALYYCYVEIPDVANHVTFQKEICCHLKGRLRVSSEGLNGVLSGLQSALEEYQKQVEQKINVKMDVKYCYLRNDLSVESQLFDSLSIKATREVVSLYEPTPQEIQRANNQQQQQNGAKEGSSNYYRRRRRNRQTKQEGEQQQQQQQQQLSDVPNSPLDDRLTALEPSPHLTPQEWNQRIGEDPNAILVDARNCYESRVGYFQVEGIPTLLTNTRKYSLLPQVLADRKKDLAGKTIYMYCTGGVRCERASVFLQALEWEGGDRPKAVYQLDGGIQRYLEHYGSSSADDSNDDDDEYCLFRGKNFVFDPRRTDPVVGRDVVGRCLLCDASHDDYDNGKAPCQENEVRCCKCRVLVLVCSPCRQTARAWGQDEEEGKPNLYCGGEKCRDEGNSMQALILT